MNKLLCAIIVAFIVGVALNSQAQSQGAKSTPRMGGRPKVETAYFAAGCFWKVQYVFSKTPGVISARSGYMNGNVESPTYQQVCTDKTGHAEAVEVKFDPAKTTYRKLLEVFFSTHDPTTMNRQGPDIGTQYRSGIFYANDAQRDEALKYKQELEQAKRFRGPIVTVIEPAKPFYEAEEYHQDYYEKHGKVCY